MISEFQDLSNKIDRLAELTLSLRRENAQLRHANAVLGREKDAFVDRLSEAQHRVHALLIEVGAIEADDDGAAIQKDVQ